MIDLSRQRGHPVYLQIKEQLERRIAAGLLAPADPLPSVRALSEQLGINPNTVVRAYRELELLGLVETRHGEGTFVARGFRREVPAGRLLEEHARKYAKAAKELSVTLDGALETLSIVWQKEEQHGAE